MSGNTLRIALAGNPNAGKTTLFNALTGAHHKVGNYPGVTVEKREGVRVRGDRQYHFIDLPGIYSLTAYSIDEVVARDFLLEEKPDIIVDVLDSTNLERNLYLCLQMQELGVPVIGALNMSDEAAAKGILIDEKNLAETLDVPLVKTVGPKGKGVDELLDRIDRIDAARDAQKAGRRIDYKEEIEAKLAALQQSIGEDAGFAAKYPARWLAVKLLEKDADAFGRLREHAAAGKVEKEALEAALWIEKHFGKDSEIIMSEQRYGYIRGATREAVRIRKTADFSLTERIDAVIMNRFLSLPIFLLVLWGVFQLTFMLGEYPMAALETLFGFLSDALNGVITSDIIRSLVVNGIIGGVGGVFSFVPLIVILFFLLSILEDTGYMSRAAFATDKLLHAFGLHGQSIFPMMLGFGCSVPAVMAARTLKNPRDRIITILITPMMSCGAKLPVHVLLAAAFFPDNAAAMVMLIYGIGATAALGSALLLKRTVLKGDPTPFVMELPPYRAPTLRGVLWHVWEKTWQYVKKAGTVILASAILIWVITTFPAHEVSDTERVTLAETVRAEYPEADDEEAARLIETAEAESALDHSYAGRLGKFIAPVFKPMGFTWKIAASSILGFAAKEVVVSTLGIMYRVGTEETEESEGLRDAIRADADMTPLTAFCFMLFTLLIPPCFAALAAIRAEIGWKWLGFEVCFLLTAGWALTSAVYQIGKLFL
ncbi:MAG: ferrous iron transport protein B [Spirochaetaceae bacterium]|jgi:ferrous iron transport protein B|nr:ferrous iron transport protein B [Spirochaetaceae bacterium]